MENKYQYQKIVQNMITGFIVFQVNKNGKPIDLLIVEANKTFANEYGLEVDTIIGMHFTELIPGIENDKGDWIMKYSEVADRGIPHKLNTQIR